MFDAREITALVLGSRMVAAWGDAELASAAKDALRKIEAVLTPALRDKIDAVPIYAPAIARQPGGVQPPVPRHMLEQLRGAIEKAHIIAIHYNDQNAQPTERRLRPMALLFWGQVWTLVAWCELRHDFRSFRADRIQTLRILEEPFTQERGQRYEDFIARVEREFNPKDVDPNSLAIG